METTIVFGGYIGIMEETMETFASLVQKVGHATKAYPLYSDYGEENGNYRYMRPKEFLGESIRRVTDPIEMMLPDTGLLLRNLN